MTIAYINSAIGTGSNITVSEAVATGDTLIVFYASTGGGAPTDNASGGTNTYTALNTALTTVELQAYGCISTKAASAGTLVITPPTVDTMVAYVHLSGCASFDSATNAATAASGAPNPGNVTPTHSGETIVCGEAGLTSTAGTGYTLGAASGNTGAVQYQIGAASGSQATAFSSGGSGVWSAIAVTINPLIIGQIITNAQDGSGGIWETPRVPSQLLVGGDVGRSLGASTRGAGGSGPLTIRAKVATNWWGFDEGGAMRAALPPQQYLVGGRPGILDGSGEGDFGVPANPKKFYFVNSAAPSSLHGALQDGGTAPATATLASTGWTVGTTALSNYSLFKYNTKQATGSFGTTQLPNAAPNTSDCWRTQTPYTGYFASDTWTINVSLIAGVALSGAGNLRVRVWRSRDPSGQTNITEITTSTLVMSSVTNLATATAQNTTVQWSPGVVTLTDEYLFFEMAWDITTASASSTASAEWRTDATHSTITTPLFVPTTLGVVSYSNPVFFVEPPMAMLPPSAFLSNGSGVGILGNGPGATTTGYGSAGSRYPVVTDRGDVALAPVTPDLPAAVQLFGGRVGHIMGLGPGAALSLGAGDTHGVAYVSHSPGYKEADFPPSQELLGGGGSAASGTGGGWRFGPSVSVLPYQSPPLPGVAYLTTNIELPPSADAPAQQLSDGGIFSPTSGGALAGIPQGLGGGFGATGIRAVPLPFALELPPVQSSLAGVAPIVAVVATILSVAVPASAEAPAAVQLFGGRVGHIMGLGPGAALSLGAGDTNGVAYVSHSPGYKEAEVLPEQGLLGGQTSAFGPSVSVLPFTPAVVGVAYLTNNEPLPPSAELPPFDALTDGSGFGIVDNVPGASTTGYGSVGWRYPIVTDAGALALPPESLLPPPQYSLAGVIPAAAAVAVILSIAAPGSADLPALVQLSDGGIFSPTSGGALSGYPQGLGAGSGATGIRYGSPPAAEELPTPKSYVSLVAGAGGPGAPGIRTALLLPPSADLPPQDYLLVGRGGPGELAVFAPPPAPPTADLAPSQRLLTGSGGFGALVTSYGLPPPSTPLLPERQFVVTGYGGPGKLAVVTAPLVPPSADLPPLQALPQGAGGAQPGIRLQDLLPPTADLPPLDAVFAGYGGPGHVGIVVPDLLPPDEQLPPSQAIVVGRGGPGKLEIAIPFVPPTTELPPAQELLKGAGSVGFLQGIAYGLPAPAELLPEAQRTLPGYNPPRTSGAVLSFTLPPTAELPPAHYQLVGYGGPGEPGIRLAVVTPATADLPPLQTSIAGFGSVGFRGLAQPFLLPPSAELPPTQERLAGFGSVGAPGLRIIVLPPPSAELPPLQARYAGSGSVGFLQGVAYGLPSPIPPLLPELQRLVAGFSPPASPVPPLLFTLPPGTELPPAQYRLVGTGGPGAPGVRIEVVPPPSAELPPAQASLRGTGGPGAPGLRLQDLLPPATDLPPQDYLLAGYGGPGAPGIRVVALPPPSAELPPQDAVRVGFGSVGKLGTLYGLPAPSADLPPLQLRLVGSGGPGHPGITVAPLLPPSADLPPLDALPPGVVPVKYQVFEPIALLLPPTADLPPEQYSLRGTGGFGQPGVRRAQDLLPYVADLPPQQYRLVGKGGPGKLAVYAVPIPPSADLPPPQRLDKGTGGFGHAGLTVAPVVPPTADLPPAELLLRGTGGPGARVVTVPVILPPLAELPPPVAVFIGFGGFGEPGIRLAFLPPPSAELPPAQSTLRGHAGFGATGIRTAPLVPPSAELPPSEQSFLGANPVKPPFLGHGLPAPFVAELPPPQALERGYGGPGFLGVVQSVVHPPASAELPPAQAMAAGVPAVPPPTVFYALPPPLAELPPPQFSRGQGNLSYRTFVFRDVALLPPTADLPPPSFLIAGGNTPPPRVRLDLAVLVLWGQVFIISPPIRALEVWDSTEPPPAALVVQSQVQGAAPPVCLASWDSQSSPPAATMQVQVQGGPQPVCLGAWTSTGPVARGMGTLPWRPEP